MNSANLENKTSKVEAIISYCIEPRTREQLAAFLGLKSASYAVKRYVKPLIDKGKLAMTLPDTPNSPEQKYFSVIAAE